MVDKIISYVTKNPVLAILVMVAIDLLIVLAIVYLVVT